MIIFLSKGRILFVIFAILGRLDECADKSCMLVGCMIIDQQSTVYSALSTGSGMLIVLLYFSSSLTSFIVWSLGNGYLSLLLCSFSTLASALNLFSVNYQFKRFKDSL